MKKRHSRNIHIGNQGEHIVATKLSKYCIVRDVGQGKDTGIDLYCEIVHDENLELSLHFFCQVKTGKKFFNINTIDGKYFEYWGNQPVPAFLIAVKYTKEQDIQKTNKLWVYDIPWILVKMDAKVLGMKKLYRDLDDKFMLCEESNNKDRMSLEDFIYHHVPWTHGLWQLRRFGLVLPNPEIKEKDKKVMISGLTDLYKEKILNIYGYTKILLNHDKENQ